MTPKSSYKYHSKYNISPTAIVKSSEGYDVGGWLITVTKTVSDIQFWLYIS